MSRRAVLPRSRYTCLRLLLLCMLGSGLLSIVYYWENVSRDVVVMDKDSSSALWERSRINEDEEDDNDEDEKLMRDSITQAPENEFTTLAFDLAEQLEKDVVEFGSELQKLGFKGPEPEDRHIAVEVPEGQPWEMELVDLDDDDEDKDYGEGLVEDDHVPGLVDDVLQPGQARPVVDLELDEKKKKHPLVGDHKDSLLEEELEAIAKLAEEDAIRESEDDQWTKVANHEDAKKLKKAAKASKISDIEEAKKWRKAAKVNWEEEEEEMIQEAKEAEERKRLRAKKRRKEELKREKQRKKQAKGRKNRISPDDDEEEEDEEEEEEEEELVEEEEDFEEMTTTELPFEELSTLEPTTPEPFEETERDEEEEMEIFSSPADVRKIERILGWVGLGKHRRLRLAVEAAASPNRTIIVTLTDSRYTMLTLNFYENVVLKLGLTNVLFASLDGKLCRKLEALKIPCFLYERESIKPEDWKRGYRKLFNSKIYYRTRLILEIVALGYTVLYSDVDTAYITDPFPHLDYYCGNCDVAFQQQREAPGRPKLSWGINYVKPTLSSLYFYYALTKKTYNRTISLPNYFINRLERQNKLNLTRLPYKKFRSGIDYFQRIKFAWDGRCRGCVSVHSDETFSKESKIYRFKELLLWQLNIDGYYNDRTRKYLMYDNPYIFHNDTETLIMEMRALRNALALGQILQRIVILPRFHCYVPPPLVDPVTGALLEPEPDPVVHHKTKWCNLHGVLRVEEFHRWFMGRYREHVFLGHPKVRQAVKQSLSKVYYIGQTLPQDPGPDGTLVTAANVTLIRPGSALHGAHSEEIRELLKHEDAFVLRFHSLYYGFSHFLSEEVANGFNRRIKFGFDFRKRVRYNVKKFKVKKPIRYGEPGYIPHGMTSGMYQGAPVPPVYGILPGGPSHGQVRGMLPGLLPPKPPPVPGQPQGQGYQLPGGQGYQLPGSQGYKLPGSQGYQLPSLSVQSYAGHTGQLQADPVDVAAQHHHHAPHPPKPAGQGDMFPSPPHHAQSAGHGDMFLPPPSHQAPPHSPPDAGHGDMFLPAKPAEAAGRGDMFLPPAPAPPGGGHGDLFLPDKAPLDLLDDPLTSDDYDGLQDDPLQDDPMDNHSGPSLDDELL